MGAGLQRRASGARGESTRASTGTTARSRMLPRTRCSLVATFSMRTWPAATPSEDAQAIAARNVCACASWAYALTMDERSGIVRPRRACAKRELYAKA